jgi:hypothetical protein
VTKPRGGYLGGSINPTVVYAQLEIIAPQSGGETRLGQASVGPSFGYLYLYHLDA